MCWPANDASEKIKANSGDLFKSISCAASYTMPELALASYVSCPGLRYKVPGTNWVYTVLLLSYKSDHCLDLVYPIEIKQLVAIHRC